MKAAWLSALGLLGLSLAIFAQAPALKITSPTAGAVITGRTRLEATITPAAGQLAVVSVTFFVNGRVVCTVERPPFVCPWDPGSVVRGHHIRVVADLADGGQLVDNVRTKDLGYAEQVRTDAVLVPTIITSGGRFVRGLKQQDFELREDGVAQPIASLVAEDSPLELVVAIDISDSMESALGDVKKAVKQLLSKLRPGDLATIVGFNDTTFIVAEREKDQRAREEAVDLLTSWGGTALYDATVRALDLVSGNWSRKAVVLFSDGDDRDSLTQRKTALERVEASDAMIYTVGFGSGATVARLRDSLEEYAKSTGGRAFFPKNVKDLDEVFQQIVTELANQYVLTYSPTNVKPDGRWRDIKVQMKNGKNYQIRARRGYRAHGPHDAGR